MYLHHLEIHLTETTLAIAQGAESIDHRHFVWPDWFLLKFYQIAFKVIGNDLTITFAAEAGQLQLNVMEPVIAVSLNESIELLINGIQTLDEKCIQGVVANEQTCFDSVMRSVGIITLLDPILGHAKCDEIGKQCIAENKTIQEVVLEQGLLTQEQLDQIFSFENMLSEIAVQPYEEIEKAG